jgi:hypothetical protein
MGKEGSHLGCKGFYSGGTEGFSSRVQRVTEGFIRGYRGFLFKGYRGFLYRGTQGSYSRVQRV